jgi:hypothetical protein
MLLAYLFICDLMFYNNNLCQRILWWSQITVDGFVAISDMLSIGNVAFITDTASFLNWFVQPIARWMLIGVCLIDSRISVSQYNWVYWLLTCCAQDCCPAGDLALGVRGYLYCFTIWGLHSCPWQPVAWITHTYQQVIGSCPPVLAGTHVKVIYGR